MVMIFEKVMVMGGYELWLLVVMGYGYGLGSIEIVFIYLEVYHK